LLKDKRYRVEVTNFDYRTRVFILIGYYEKLLMFRRYI